MTRLWPFRSKEIESFRIGEAQRTEQSRISNTGDYLTSAPYRHIFARDRGLQRLHRGTSGILFPSVFSLQFVYVTFCHRHNRGRSATTG